MRAMPNMHVYSPATPTSCGRSCATWPRSPQPTYMQLVRLKMPKLFDDGCPFDPHRAVRPHEGGDVTLVATGYMTRFALEAARPA